MKGKEKKRLTTQRKLELYFGIHSINVAMCPKGTSTGQAANWANFTF